MANADVQTVRRVIDMITGGWRAQAVHVAATLGLPDHVEAGCRTIGELAARTGAKEEGIRRLMRLLVSMGVFEGDDRNGYRNTELSAAFLDRPGSLRDMCLFYGEEFYTAWGHAVAAVSTVSSGFEMAYGQPFYAYLGQNSDAAERFQAVMRSDGVVFDRVPDVFDFGGKSVMDIGGGSGQLLAAILKAVPSARGVLIDREHMVPIARENLAAAVGLDRVELVGGDMFVAVPSGGDVYLLCRVLAGWEDDAVVKVFENCRQAMAGSSSRLLIIERLVADDAPALLPALWDVHLLMTNGGRHRTRDSFGSLLIRAGLEIERVVDLPMETTILIAAPCP